MKHSSDMRGLGTAATAPSLQVGITEGSSPSARTTSDDVGGMLVPEEAVPALIELVTEGGSLSVTYEKKVIGPFSVGGRVVGEVTMPNYDRPLRSRRVYPDGRVVEENLRTP